MTPSLQPAYGAGWGRQSTRIAALLARTPAQHVILDTACDVPVFGIGLVETLNRIGVTEPITVVVERLPQADLFPSFRQYRPDSQRLNECREPDGSPAAVW
ncbi:hypothetical protein ACFY8C_27185 [Streptomyces flavochromogenes]|uniref:Uncharacterized protein n=1 Tax=Streptomyces flavochromogenes TaxID=68199 RepID=A0ABW6XX05_9ACTN